MSFELAVTIGIFVFGGLISAIWAFFWNKYRMYDQALNMHTSDISELKKDCNMAYNKIMLVESNTATKDRLEKTMNEFRIEVTSILDKQEQRHTSAIMRIEESIKSLQTSFREDIREIINQLKE